MKFTDKRLKALKAKEKRYIEWEENAHGHGTLGVRVSPADRRSWILMYFFEGRPRMLTLGVYPRMSVAQAHKAHGEAIAQLEKGEDPGIKTVAARKALRKAPTIRELADLYVEKWAMPRKRSWKDDRRMLDKDVIPAWGRRKAQNITRRDVIALLDEIVERDAPVTANRTLALVRKMFNFAISRDILQSSPCVAVTAPGLEKKRDRVLSEDEIKRMFKKLPEAHMSESSRLAIEFLLITAQRCSEVLGAEWEEMNLDFGWWVIPSEKSKNKLQHRVPLAPQAIEILNRAKALNQDERYVFPSVREKKRMLHTVLARAVKRSAEVFDMEAWRPHDLRRTAASQMTSMGFNRLVVAKILNHSEKGVTAIYDRHSYDAEKREALEAWGSQIEKIKKIKRKLKTIVNKNEERSKDSLSTVVEN